MWTHIQFIAIIWTLRHSSTLRSPDLFSESGRSHPRCQYFSYELISFPILRLNFQDQEIRGLDCIDHTSSCTVVHDLGSTVQRSLR